MSRRVRVLHVIHNLNYGGMERLFADIVERLDPAEFESHVMVLGYFGRFAKGLERHATMHQAPEMGRASMLRPAGLTRAIATIAPDVVHSHAGVWHKVSLASRRAGVPWIVHTEHGREHPDPLLARSIGYFAARRTDVVVAVSEVLRQHLAAQVVPRSVRLEVIENGVDTVLHAPGADDGALRQALGISPTAPVIGSIGRLERIKGYDIVVAAYAELRRSWVPAVEPPVLLLAGDGLERAALEALATTLGVRDDVHFLGWRDDIAALHRSFTLFTMGSRSEGTSVSLLEAMSAGLCPVVTDVGGNRVVLGEGLAHRLVPPEEPPALAQAWAEVLLKVDRRAEDARRARARVESAFSLQRMVERYAAVYREGPVGTQKEGMTH
jgi:glycosyltransferase involved in cell wall biosynthesis